MELAVVQGSDETIILLVIAITMWIDHTAESNGQFIIIKCTTLCFCLLLVNCSSRRESKSKAQATPSPSITTELESRIEQAQERGVNPAQFNHGNRMHGRLPCLLCHRRETNSPRPVMPGANSHAPCAGCHALQFKDPANPICGICHTNAQSGALKPFPQLTSFDLTFDHYRHVRMPRLGCTACHKPAHNGIAMSIPRGFDAHRICFQCHSSRARADGRDLSSCGVCHRAGSYSRTPEFMAAFRVGFSHAQHGTAKKLSCSDCHQIRPGLSQAKQVSAPVPLNHHASGRVQSCMSCHNGKRAFGGDDFSACQRCHKGPAWHF